MLDPNCKNRHEHVPATELTMQNKSKDNELPNGEVYCSHEPALGPGGSVVRTWNMVYRARPKFPQ